MINSLPEDLILEIVYKLKYTNLAIFLSNKRLLIIYNYNKQYIIKSIINSYNVIFTSVSNINFLITHGIINFNEDFLTNGINLDEAIDYYHFFTKNKIYARKISVFDNISRIMRGMDTLRYST